MKNNLFLPRVKIRVCKRCGKKYLGGIKSLCCEKCYKPNKRNQKDFLKALKGDKK